MNIIQKVAEIYRAKFSEPKLKPRLTYQFELDKFTEVMYFPMPISKSLIKSLPVDLNVLTNTSQQGVRTVHSKFFHLKKVRKFVYQT